MKRVLPWFVLMLAILLPAASAGAWSHKEHVLMTRLAVQRLLADESTPAGMKVWLRDICPEAADGEGLRDFVINQRVGPDPKHFVGLSYWAIYPDTERNTHVELFGIDEGKMHFIDLEFFNPDPSQRTYRHDLSAKPKFEDVPRDKTDRRYIDAGYLPLRVEQSYDELVQAIEEGRLRPMGGDRLNNAAAWAGRLAHYLQDNTQPHHATIDYRSASYFPGEERAPNVHGMMEYGFLDDEALAYPRLRAEYFEKLNEYVERLAPQMSNKLGDPFANSLQMSLDAYDALPLIGEAAVAAVKAGSREEPDLTVFAHHRGKVGPNLPVGGDGTASVLEVKAMLAAVAVLRTEAGLRQAWLEAQGDYERPAEHRTPGVSRPAPKQ